jgi:non-ribosomal peptide synthase protein (TIGR01720 family)
LLEREAVSAGRVAEVGYWEGVVSGAGLALGDVRVVGGRDHEGTVRSLSRVVAPGRALPLLTSVPGVFHGGVNDVLLSALAVAVRGWRGGGGGSAVLVDVEGHGREEIFAGVDVSRTVGWFTSVYPVRLDAGRFDLAGFFAGGPEVGVVVRRVKELLRAVPGHGIGYGLLRYLRPGGEALAGAVPPVILFNYLGRVAARAATAWDVAQVDVPAGEPGLAGEGAVYPVSVSAVAEDRDDGPYLRVTWSWPEALFGREVIAGLADRWVAALDAIAAYAARPDADKHTPSDLPLLTMTQQQLDELEARWR